ncbi:hypothetical protein LJK87_41425 [Paenibacillus sp. P25]|nr:hypothetical protein LJK87_41425 [Paenibacillus sp. P25]
MKLKEMIHENNRLREELSAENREYYEEMLVYIRSSDIHQRKAEEPLLEMLQHLLEAQREGRSAVHVFGDQPARYCQELAAAAAEAGMVRTVAYASCGCMGFRDSGVFCPGP